MREEKEKKPIIFSILPQFEAEIKDKTLIIHIDPPCPFNITKDEEDDT